MKFSAKLDALLKAISPVMAVSETGAIKEHPDSYRITLIANKTGLVAESNNGNIAARREISASDVDYNVVTQGEITTVTKNLSNVLASFDANEVLTFELNNGEMEIRPESDPEKLQTLPIEVRKIEMPILATQFSKTVTVSKAVLSETISKVFWGIGTEDLRPEFYHWPLKFSKDVVIAAAGDGGRFAVDEVSGSGLVDAKGTIDILIYKDQNAALYKSLEMVDSDTVEIKEFVRKDSDKEPDQIVFVLGDFVLILMGHDPKANWPDISKYTNRFGTPYQFTTDASDWVKEFQGVVATISKEVRDINDVHTTKMVFDSNKKVLTLKVEGSMKAVRKIPLLDAVVASGSPPILEFSVETANLKDMFKYASGTMQFEAIDSKKPMMVRYFADKKVQSGPLYKVNQSAQTKEQFMIFFGSFNK